MSADILRLGRSPREAAGPLIEVVELNPYAPRPFVFTDLALSLRDAIRLAGYRCEHRQNAADPEAVAIVLGAGAAQMAFLADADPARCIVANFEQIGSTSALAGPDYLAFLGRHRVLDYHSGNVEALRQANGAAQAVFELPVVPGPSVLYRPALDMAPSVDVLFFGTPCPRRDTLVQRLQAAGLSTEVVAGAYGDELVPAVRRARLVVHAHFYETGLFPVARFLQPVVQGVPIVCEDSVFSAHSDWSRSGIRFAAYDDLVAACVALLADPADQLARVQRTQRFVATLDFATPFGELLRAALACPSRASTVLAPALLSAPAPADGAADGPSPPAGTLASPQSPETDGLDPAVLPPEAHLAPPPLEFATRKPGEGPYGRWVAWGLIVFSLFTIVQSMRAWF
jgi:hypothetical protein